MAGLTTALNAGGTQAGYGIWVGHLHPCLRVRKGRFGSVRSEKGSGYENEG